MPKLDTLRSSSFGAQVAEDESAELGRYFVETDQWSRIYRGEIDVIRGDKGSGKSAIYALLLSRTDEFLDQRILLVPAEKPRGTPVFKDIVANPPAEEREFVALWKVYFLSLIGQKLRKSGVDNDDAQVVYRYLEGAKLLARELDLRSILSSVKEFVSAMFAAESVEGGLVVEPNTGMVAGVNGKITFREPNNSLREAGYVSIDSLLEAGNRALDRADMTTWILLDRLDVAFAETHELERNALRALFKAYRDIGDLDNIRLKIFLRSDIWSRIMDGGFREASHINKVISLEWTTPALMNLVVKRLMSNEDIKDHLSIESDTVFANFDIQQEVFYRLFPDQVEQGSQKPNTFDWMVSRCADGSQRTAPRELIHLLASLRETEISRLERGEDAAPNEQLFDRSVFKSALPTVSKTRLIQHLYAEYPDLKDKIEALRSQKTEQSTNSLIEIWSLNEADTVSCVNKLVEVGFFQRRGPRGAHTYWVPFLYRDALTMSQGRADDASI